MAVSVVRNVYLKIFEKQSNYKDLGVEISRMRHTRTSTIPVVVEALGLIGKSSD